MLASYKQQQRKTAAVGVYYVLLTNGTLKAPRKRVLSERGEAEAKYPVVDKRTLFNSWRGSRLLKALWICKTSLESTDAIA
uniref:Arm-DNA-bind_5 domain-containing protein n=1 Tax=Ascaris lumbricoides TaxID=6252 RepID=A0A0M3IER6_ASCLU